MTSILRLLALGFQGGSHSPSLQRTLGLVKAMMAELTWLPPHPDEMPPFEKPRCVLVLWIWQNSVYAREPGSVQRLPLIDNLAWFLRVDGPYARLGLLALQDSEEAQTSCGVYFYSWVTIYLFFDVRIREQRIHLASELGISHTRPQLDDGVRL